MTLHGRFSTSLIQKNRLSVANGLENSIQKNRRLFHSQKAFLFSRKFSLLQSQMEVSEPDQAGVHLYTQTRKAKNKASKHAALPKPQWFYHLEFKSRPPVLLFALHTEEFPRNVSWQKSQKRSFRPAARIAAAVCSSGFSADFESWISYEATPMPHPLLLA